MSKKVVFTLNPETINTLSSFNVADCKLEELKKAFKKDSAELNQKIESIRTQMAEDEENQALTQEKRVKAESEIAGLLFKLSDRRKQFVKDCAPHKEDRAEALKSLPEGLYTAYSKAWTTGNDTLLGSACKKWLQDAGCEGTDNETALRKFASVMKVRISGSRRTSAKKREETGMRLTCKSDRQFNEFFMLALIDYLLTEKGVIVEAEDHTISMKEWND